MILRMALFRSHRKFEKRMAKAASDGRALLTNIGWVSAGLTAVAIGLVVGRELRQRYKFKRRTPYDVYGHSGDERDVEFGMGI